MHTYSVLLTYIEGLKMMLLMFNPSYFEVPVCSVVKISVSGT